ncbi:hypothetical protein EDM57_04190 [Brevibacillus gelatini]|uniref:Recombinase family protein n=1 Tax=Brevibacillus gelatini TaxID=1655277 RepID=A0A3M8B7D9_9BACL|nr:recombinase family protein [Brevibacillus gelatini]RNB59348.1 hypothetical protein EDM57_04190 [Brevibacillus gelatini]
MKKRVWALYRVSTEKQAIEDDIPMQRNAVRKFVQKRPDWELLEELSELGVSGFKKSVQERDKLQVIKKAAEEGKFDILIVWKDDRLGRNKFEIPFMLEFLKKQGVEVWSVEDGILNNNEKHEDSLLSFLRFWVAEGESKKTSIRVSEALKQMNEQGRWTGGNIPFGYEMFDTGIKHPKYDKTIKDLMISENESKIVKLIFYLVVEKGYGADRITNFLNENSFLSKDGKKWRSNAVRRILRNPIYIGRQRYNTADKDGIKLKPFREDLVIIPEDIFNKTQKILDVRNKKIKINEPINVPSTSANLLLSGLARCGYCGSKLYADSSTKTRTRLDGTKASYTYWRYVCRESLHHRETHPKSYFGAKKFDYRTESEIIKLLNIISNSDEFNNLVTDVFDSIYEQKQFQIKNLEKEKQNLNLQLEAIKNLIVKIALGESKLTEDYVMEQIRLKESEIDNCQKLIDQYKAELGKADERKKEIDKLKKAMEEWEDKYRRGDHDTKKMMLANAVNRVYFFDKKIDVKLRTEFDEILQKLMKTGDYSMGK